jgi:hypothetical protein
MPLMFSLEFSLRSRNVDMPLPGQTVKRMSGLARPGNKTLERGRSARVDLRIQAFGRSGVQDHEQHLTSDPPPLPVSPSRIARLPAWGIIALCAGFLLAGSACLAANDGSGAPSDPAAAGTSQDIEALLHKVEQQISAGHALSPAGDNAMDTWMLVLQADRATPGSTKVRSALAEFAAQLQIRASDERAAGRLVVAGDLTVFADQADRVMSRSSVATTVADGSQAAPPRSVPEDQTSPAAPSLATGLPPRGTTPIDALATQVKPQPPQPVLTEPRAPGVASVQTKVTPLSLTAPEASPVTGGAAINPAPPPAAAVLATSDSTPAAAAESPEMVNVLLRRGDAMLRKGDVVSARLFYERAAAAGSGQGATGAGKTYDPKFLASIDAIGMKGDVARAIEWYRVASTLLGDTEGGERLKLLIAQSGR